jgi:hypothetical protein
MKKKLFPAGTSVLSLHFMVLTAVMSSCIESAPVPDEVKSSAPGFGSSKRRPEGQPLVFPAGVKVVGRPHFDESCVGRQVIGSGTIGFCIQLENSTCTPLAVTIPAGPVFVSEHAESPNGLTIQEIHLLIPAKSTLTFHLKTYSINQDRKARPGSFEAQPLLTNHHGLPDLLSVLTGKKINTEDYNGAMLPEEVSTTVQSAVHEVAHKGQLSPASREKLALLPDK